MTPAARTGAGSTADDAAAEFERLYRANVAAVTAYFARRSADPHVNARLHQLGDSQVVVVPVEPGCPGLGSLPKPLYRGVAT
jgi:hypothetical protein